jgi:hypothetical protein
VKFFKIISIAELEKQRKEQIEEERIAKEKKAEEERIAKEKKAEEERIATENKRIAKEKFQKKLNLIPQKSELESAQNFLNRVKYFVNDYPDEFDIVKISEFFILTKPIFENIFEEKQKNDLVLFKNFTDTSSNFVDYVNSINQMEIDEKINEINLVFSDLESSKITLQGKLKKNPTASNVQLTIDTIKSIEILLENPESINQLKEYNEIFKTYITSLDKKEAIIAEEKRKFDSEIDVALNNISELKEYLKKNLMSDLAPLILEQLKLLEKAIEKEIFKDLVSANKNADQFIYKKFVEPEEKKAEEERIAKEKKAEEVRIAKEKKAEEERIAKEKKAEEVRIAEEKRIAEEERIAEEKRKEEERIAEEKLKETFKKYNVNSQFQKDFVSAILSGDFIKLEDLKFSKNDRLIEIFGLSENDPDHIGNEKLKIEKIEIKNLNKNVFYKIIKSVEEKRFDFTLLNEKKWSDELKFINLSVKDTDFEFNSKTLLFKNFEFKNFEDNVKLVQNSQLNKDEINYISAALSFSLGKIYSENILFNINNTRTIKSEYSDVSNFTLLDWGQLTSKNYSDADVLTNTIVSYTDSYASNIKFDKSEIINFINNFDKNNFDIEKNYSDLFNMIDSLGNTVTNNIVVKDLSTKSKIGSLKSFVLKNLNFDYIANQKQKFLTSLDLNIDGLDLNFAVISPEFSSYFKLLGYDTVKFDFGTSWNLNKKNNDLGINLDLGITNAASITLSTIFSGLSFEIFDMSEDLIGAYFLTNFKINDIKLSLIDNSLRNKLLNYGAQQQNLSVQEFKKTLISQIDSYSATTQKTKLFVEYRQAVVNFINGSRKIKLQISPETPVSIAELTPYFLNPDINSIISKLNLHVSN